MRRNQAGRKDLDCFRAAADCPKPCPLAETDCAGVLTCLAAGHKMPLQVLFPAGSFPIPRS
jgi:hypothetical protein